MNLFWKKILRQLQTTQKFEKQLNKMYTQTPHSSISNGEEVESMNLQQLETYIQSDTFAQNKKRYIHTKYKNTDEYKLLKKYEKLHQNPKIKEYYQTLKSPILKTYNDFKANPDTLQLGNLSIAQMSEQIDKLKAFENSDTYKNYTALHQSLLIREYEEIAHKTNDPAFVKKNRFWKNPNRWQLTNEYRIEQRYLQLTGKKKTTKPTSLFCHPDKQLKTILDENFDGREIDTQQWQTGFYKSNPQLISHHSFADEHQAYNGTENIILQEGQCTLSTRFQPTKALAWDTQRGFCKKEFDYTSAILQNGKTFQQQYGIFSAKIKCEGKVHHSVWLKGNNKLPHINLFYYDGKKITIGNATQHKYIGKEIKGIDKSKYYIYTVEWTPKALVWYINNIEVFRTQQQIPHQKLHIGISSFLPQAAPPAEGNLTIDWVKAFSTT